MLTAQKRLCRDVLIFTISHLPALLTLSENSIAIIAEAVVKLGRKQFASKLKPSSRYSTLARLWTRQVRW